MSTSLFTFLSMLFFTALVAVISYRFTRQAKDVGAHGYFMASGGLNGWFIAGSMMLTNLSIDQLVGLNGDSYAHNLSSMAWEATAAVSTIALALFSCLVTCAAASRPCRSSSRNAMTVLRAE